MLNKVTLIGYTGKAVEQKYTPGGTAVARVSVATSKRVKKNEEWQSVTQWHDCVLFGKAAESSYIAGIQKGTQVFVEGELQHRKYAGNRQGEGRMARDRNRDQLTEEAWQGGKD